MINRLPRKSLVAAAAATLLLVTFGQLPGGTKWWQALQNAGHAPAFFVLSIAVLNLFPARRADGNRNASTYLGAFLICLSAGVLVELVQSMIGRDLSMEDIAADALGIVSGLTGYACLNTHAPSHRARYTALLSACAGCALIALTPLGLATAAYMHRSAQFPVIAEFDSPLDLYFVATQGSEAMMGSGSSQNGSMKSALRVTVEAEFPGAWPGVSFDEPEPDWTGYQALVIDIANPEESLLNLTLRVHDRSHNQQLSDRYNQTIEIGPQASSVIRVPIATLRAAPQGREMDIRHVAGIVIFGDLSLAGKTFQVNRIWLE